jgi:hypothetical protein
VRIAGYDNAHGISPKKMRHQGRKIAWDHVHKTEKISSFEFDSASQLLEDFWKLVDEYV